LMGLRVRFSPGHGCLSLVSVVYRQVDVSASADPSSRRVLQNVVCLCIRENKRPCPARDCCATQEKCISINLCCLLPPVCPMYCSVQPRQLKWYLRVILHFVLYFYVFRIFPVVFLFLTWTPTLFS
jgi:hypothetical protein